MTLLLDLAFIPKISKLVTDQRLEESQSQSIQEETSFITEFTTGNNTIQCPLHTT